MKKDYGGVSKATYYRRLRNIKKGTLCVFYDSGVYTTNQTEP